MKTLLLENGITVPLTKITEIETYRGFSVKIRGTHYVANFNTNSIPSKYEIEDDYNIGFDIGENNHVPAYLLNKLKNNHALTKNEIEAFQELISPPSPSVNVNGKNYNFAPYMTKLKGFNLWVIHKDKLLEKELDFIENITYIDINDIF